MNLRLLICMFYFYWISSNISIVNCKISRKTYSKYFIEVLNHIRVQKGWNLMHHLQVKHSSITCPIRETFAQNIVDENFLSLYNNIIHLINYKYMEIVKIFANHLDIIIALCKTYLNLNSEKNLIYCTSIIQNSMKNSLVMFEHLYDSITVLSYLDVTLAFSKKCKNCDTIVDEIYFVKENINSKTKPENFIDIDPKDKKEKAKIVLLDVKYFIETITKITQNFFENNVVVVNNSMDDDLTSINAKKYSNIYSNKLSFVNLLVEKLDTFYEETILNYYENLGFKQLLNPTESRLMPPLDLEISQDHEIQKLNAFINGGNWNLLYYINIIINDDQRISASHITRDQANNNNFRLKKIYFLQLIKCRFSEILMNYDYILSTTLEYCEFKKPNFNKFIKCMTTFLNTFKATHTLFNFMLKALESLKEHSVWDCYSISPSNLSSLREFLVKCCEYISNDCLTNDDFGDSKLFSHIHINNMANRYMYKLIKFRKFLIKSYKALQNQTNKCCDYGNKPETTWLHATDLSNAQNFSKDELFTVNKQNIFNRWLIFFNEFINNDYEGLGFVNMVTNNS
ncbi:uncharacterized protein LOC126904338 [Daktulosphaira vitifoliae]|uniref:uncharacterized protein LOC126904338 n=1 Tax=Daktulosphaira vitifoliae TaxID=58002 RepID=UPI0021AA88DD|nr:uncharacterized protein LOC126904338 [Daktulosphaira vitifoliae]